MRRLRYVNPRGEELDFYTSPYLITSLEGLSPPTNPIMEQKAPYQDGTSYLDSLLEPRTIVLEAVIRAPNNFSLINFHKDLLSRALSGKMGLGTVYYSSDGITEKHIPAIPINSPLYANKEYTTPNQSFLVQFYCPDPLFLGDENVQYIETLLPLLEFPESFDVGGIELSQYLVGEPIYIINGGHIESPVRIVFYGPASNPKIENQTTGQYIKINKVLLAGDVLTIDTAYGVKTVTLTTGGVTSNAIQYLDLASEFWSLNVGQNAVRFTDDSSSTSARCGIFWRSRYLGV